MTRHDALLPWRLFAFTAAARWAAVDANVLDTHFALYGLAPLFSRRVRRLPAVVHFQGPWADENVAPGRRLRAAPVVAAGATRERAVYRRASRGVVLSSAFRRLLIERYRVSPWRVRIEAPGVDRDRFRLVTAISRGRDLGSGSARSSSFRYGDSSRGWVSTC